MARPMKYPIDVHVMLDENTVNKLKAIAPTRPLAEICRNILIKEANPPERHDPVQGGIST